MKLQANLYRVDGQASLNLFTELMGVFLANL